MAPSSLRTLVPVLMLTLCTGCYTRLPAAIFGWGRGAEPLPQGTTRLQVGGGGGATMGGAGVVGGGLGVAVEHQLLKKLALRGELGGAFQSPGYFEAPGLHSGSVLPLPYVGASVYPSTFVGAAYGGAQLNMSNTVALRTRLGLGSEITPGAGTAPYGGIEVGLVGSSTTGTLETFSEMHAAIKVLSIQNGMSSELLPVANLGPSVGVNWRFAPGHALYGAFHADFILQAASLVLLIPYTSASLQAGYSFQF